MKNEEKDGRKRKAGLISKSETTADATGMGRAACIANVQTYIGYKVGKFIGDGTLTGLTIRKMAGAEALDLRTKSAIIAAGLEPDTSLAAPRLKLNPRKETMISPDCSTSHPGIFAAGEVTDAFGKRIIIASGEGAKAALSARHYLLNYGRRSTLRLEGEALRNYLFRGMPQPTPG